MNALAQIGRDLDPRPCSSRLESQANILDSRNENDPEAETGVETTIVDPLEGARWDDLVARFSDATPFHTAAWARVLARTYQHRPHYLQFSRGQKTIGLVPLMEIRSPITGRRAVSLPFSDFCCPLICGGDVTESISRKLEELMSKRKWRHIELRGGSDALFPGAHRSASFYAHTLSLVPGTSELWERLASPVRRAIRKAVVAGVTVEVANTRTAIVEFYRLHSQTRRRHGLPPQPFRFFLNIYDEIIKPGRGFIMLASNGGRAIAAAIFFGFNGLAVYKFGASDHSFQSLRPNNLVMWEAIRLLTRRGCRTLHFGRTEIGAEGLRRFKLSWGTEEGTIEYFKFALRAQVWKDCSHNGSGFHNQLFRRLPLAVNRFAGSLIYPHLD